MHSTLLGGSIAARRLNCPASFQEQLRAPPGVTSVYADHGSAMHAAMTYWLENPNTYDLTGMTFNGHVISAEDFGALLDPAMLALDELEIKFGEHFELLGTERRVQYPGVPGAFGTLDVLLRSPTHLLLADFKFGSGVLVTAYDEDGWPNPQLMFYLASIKRLIGKRTIVLAIIQPTFDPSYTDVIVTPAQLRAFEKRMKRAIEDALSDNPERVRGEWCRFAPCKATCKLWTGPLLDLSSIGVPSVADHRDLDAWGVFLSNAKRLVDGALMYKNEIDSALLDHLKAGHRAPGFALKPKATTRKWLDDVEHVARELAKLGLADNEIYQHKIQTFTVTDAAAKRRGVTIPDSLRPKPPSTEFTLTSEDDPARVDVKEQAKAFAAALKMIIKQET